MVCFNNECHNENKLEKSISYICSCEYEYFFNKRNVVGIGFGYKIKNGFYTNELCIQVFVNRKLHINNINSQDLIPYMYKGIITDVIETGLINIASLTQKIVPAIGGYVVGNEYAVTSSSTLGCLVTDGKELFILANNHTIASTNSAPLGTKIIQPSFNYGGDFKKDVIAILSKYIPIKFIETTTAIKSPTNYVDCAIAKVINKSLVSPQIAMLGIPEGTIIPRLNVEVKKVGFKTELTTGKIISLHITVALPYKRVGKTAIFKEQIMTTYMSDIGDSGAVLLDKNNYVLGLLIANGDTDTIYTPINTVLKELNVRLSTSKD